jgi:Ser/Thr protein kinase RdoA (MazF antagonist)
VISRGALQALVVHHVSARGCPVLSPADPRVPTALDCAAPFGRALAQLHGALDDFDAPRGSEWTAAHPRTLMGADPAWIERLYSHDGARGARLTEWREEAFRIVSEASRGDFGMCHGEAYPATCRLVEDGLAIAELDWAGEGDRAYDLATFRWTLAVHAEDQADRLFAEFLDGYAAEREVPDLGALRGWVAARHLWSLRLAAGFAEHEGLARRADFAAAWPIA